MAEAQITLKLTPREFDLVREAVRSEQARAKGAADDKHTDIKLRSRERQLESELGFISQKLQ